MSVETLTDQREHFDAEGMSDAAIAASLDFCIECIDGTPTDGINLGNDEGALRTFTSEYFVPEIRWSDAPERWEARPSPDAAWEPLVVELNGETLGWWFDGNALEAAAKKYGVPLELVQGVEGQDGR